MLGETRAKAGMRCFSPTVDLRPSEKVPEVGVKPREKGMRLQGCRIEGSVNYIGGGLLRKAGFLVEKD